MTYNIIITGTKSFDDYELFVEKCDYYLNLLTADSDSDIDGIRILTGDDGKAEKMAQVYADEKEYSVSIFPLNTNKYGKRAGVVRNTTMIKFADGAICFWNGKSTGVKTTISLCKNDNVPCEVIEYTKK
jgi:hypothetical protein